MASSGYTASRGRALSNAAEGSKERFLDDAIREFVVAGDTIYLDPRAQAAVRAIVRVFAGRKDMRLHIVTTRAGDVVPDLAVSGLVAKTSAAGLTSGAGDPSKIAVLQNDIASGRIELESWSLHSLNLRLMAAALCWPFIPMRSIVGSDLERGKQATIASIADPFSAGTPVNVVAPLRCDLAIVHAAAADRSGAALFPPPHSDGGWGARASDRGVIVTTERIVESDALRPYASQRMFSASRVLALSETPFGVHPYSYALEPNELTGGYLADADFVRDYAAVLRDPDQHRAWLNTWVMQTGGEEEYLARVGRNRLEPLARRFMIGFGRGRGATTESADGATSTPAQPSSDVTAIEALSIPDRLALLAARRITESVLRTGARTVLVGVGLPHRACALAELILRERGVAVEFMLGIGLLDFDVPLGRGGSEIGSAGWLGTTTDVYGLVMGGRGGNSLAVVSTAQVDKRGNLNTNWISKTGVILAGSGGANDATTLAREVIVVCPYRAGRVVSTVDFVTCPGTNVTSVVTEFGVFSKDPGADQLELTTTTGRGDALAYVLSEITDHGWPLVLDGVPEEDGPTATELTLLRTLSSGLA